MRRVLLLSLVLLALALPVSASYMSCEDADGPNNYVTASYTQASYASVPGPGDWFALEDTCIQNGAGVGSCSGAGCYARDYYCSGSQYNWNIANTEQLCSGIGYSGCSGGACTGATSCSDGIKNGAETDVDCGGNSCPKCANGQTCVISSDCTSSICNGGICYGGGPSCSDGIENGNEDGVDCGGSCPDECPDLLISKGSNDPGNHAWTRLDSSMNVMMRVRLEVAGDETITVKRFILKRSGTGNHATGINTVALVMDNNEDGVYQMAGGTDPIVSTATWGDADTLSLTFQPYVDMTASEDAIKYVFIIYQMNSLQGQASGTYTMELKEVQAQIESSGENIIKTPGLTNTKTVTPDYVPPSCNNNGVRDSDESGVDCGGAYCPQCSTGSCYDGVQNGDESGVDCGGRCPTCSYPLIHCPNGVQDGDETGVDCGGSSCPPCSACPGITSGCDPNSPPVCDEVTRTASICLSGIYTPVAGLYENQCARQPEPTCTPGTSVCANGAVSFCGSSGFWGPANADPTLWSQYCENDACDGSEVFCDPTGMAYVCSNGQYVYQGPCAATTECNPGEVSCDYAAYSYRVCDESGRWSEGADSGAPPTPMIVFPQEGFFDVCPVNRDLLGCEDGTVQCNPEFDRQEKCVDGEWLPIEQPAAQYTAACGSVECNPGWFACNPAAERIQYCVNGQWGAESTQGYADFCEPEGATLGGNVDGGGAFSRGDDRALIGQIVNNTVVVIRSIPAFPVTPPPALEKTVVQTLQSIPWWLLALLVLLLCSTLFTIAKYHNHLVADKKGKR